MNRAYYYMLVIWHFMFEAYKRDITLYVIIKGQIKRTQLKCKKSCLLVSFTECNK